MKRFYFGFLATLFIIFYSGAQPSIKQIRVGGCGASISMVAHPKVQNLYYFTTDVGTSYRWNQVKLAWEPMLFNIQNAYGSTNVSANVAVDPNDATGNIVYSTIGYSFQQGGLFKSTDRGVTWKDLLVPVDVQPNSEQGFGQRLVVDPNNSKIIWVTTPMSSNRYAPFGYDGTQRVTNNNETYTSEKISLGGPKFYGNFIIIDPKGGTVVRNGENVSAKIYIGTNAGVYLSSDGGITFGKMTDSPANTRKADMALDGTIVVASASGVHKFQNGAWTNYSPHSANLSAPFGAIAINPNNSQQIVAGISGSGSNYNFEQYITVNGGTTWTKMSLTSDNSENPFKTDWTGDGLKFFMWDPFNQTKVWQGDFHNTLVTENIFANPVHWVSKAIGHEETVSIGNLYCPPATSTNLLHSCVADVGGFDHKSLTTPPATAMSKHFPWTPTAGIAGNMTGVAIQETDPNFIVRVGRHGWAGEGYCGYSTDGGASYNYKNWTFPTQIRPRWDGTKNVLKPVTAGGGRVAVSANSKVILWQPFEKFHLYRSEDMGVTWTIALDSAFNIFEKVSNFESHYVFPLAADKVTGNKFYVFSNYKDANGNNRGQILISTDGGKTFTVGSKSLPGYYYGQKIFMETGPADGDLWVCISGNEAYPANNGVFHSTNSGVSCTKLNESVVNFPQNVTVGAKAPNSTAPVTVYVYGKVNGGALGLYKSIDNGVTFETVQAPLRTGVKVLSMAADRNTYGRVYLASDGNGIMYIDDEPKDITAPKAPVLQPATNITINSFDITWTTAGDGDVMYDVYVNGALKSTVSTKNISISGLEGDKTYEIMVSARDAANNISNGSNVEKVTTLKTAVRGVKKNKIFEIHPNPVKDKLSLQNGGTLSSVSITDAAGKVVYNGKTNENGELNVLVGNWKRGAYFVSLIIENESYTGKIIVE